jgi:hypothetical protein
MKKTTAIDLFAEKLMGFALVDYKEGQMRIDISCDQWRELYVECMDLEEKQIISACEMFGNYNGVDINDYKEYYSENYVNVPIPDEL